MLPSVRTLSVAEITAAELSAMVKVLSASSYPVRFWMDSACDTVTSAPPLTTMTSSASPKLPACVAIFAASSLTSNSMSAVKPLSCAPTLANTELSDALTWSTPV